MKGTYINGGAAFGLLLLRLVTGIGLMVHGWPKIQNPSGWMGPDSPFPPVMQMLAALAEFVGGFALAVGLLTPLFAAILVIHFAFALSTHITRGQVWISNTGGPSFELPLLYLVSAFTLFLTGPGRMSFDYALFGRAWRVEKVTTPKEET